ncbi:MAG: UDP-N-acetylmuramate--L-alanine ligase [Candidatus Gastranaerophilales bacterium]|nr:UDP-N-acetylmuramate--L-alanine ligase [Candidatus Gastranaerophilales bacterium]
MNNRYHFIAIGGVGMSGLAKYLIQNGCEVSGSDVNDSKYVHMLREMGAVIHIGHCAENVPDNAVVIVSSAIREDNPELVCAKEKNLKICHRSDLLAEISKSGKSFIGFSGTHGKTTTSGMASYLLSKSGLNPSFVVGGSLPDYNTNAQYSAQGSVFVAELDESDGTIVKYKPDIVVINNLEPDHLDFYKYGMKSILETFERFLSGLNQDAKVLINNDNTGVMQLKNADKYLTFGLKDGDYTAGNISYNHGYTTFDIYYKKELLTPVKIILPGEHNVYNALGVVAALHQGNIDIKNIVRYFSEFTGMGRRFQRAGEIDGIVIYDDYAHHPTEIKSTLSAMKSFTGKKITAVFQPHRYTRLQSLWEDFKDALVSADRIVITDVYAASEDEIEGINSARFAEEIQRAEYLSGTMSDVAKALLPTLDRESVVIGLGAGTITNLARELEKAKEDLLWK